MSALVERITAVLREHELESHLNTGWICACGWKDGTKTYPTHPAHVAERVAEALQLTEEQHTYADYETKVEGGGEGVFWYAGQTSTYKGMKTVRRWVSEWTPAEEQR